MTRAALMISTLAVTTALGCGGGDNGTTGAVTNSGSRSGASGTAPSQCGGACCPKPGQTTGPVSTDSGQCSVTIDLAGPASACGLDSGVVIDGFCDNLCPLPSAPMYLLGCSVYADTSGAHATCQYGGQCGK
jgi:hypothetical protein